MMKLGVAIVRQENTGVCLSRTGVELADSSTVECDGAHNVIDEKNAFLIFQNDGIQRYDGGDFELGCYADHRHYVNVSFQINKKGRRTAKFQYILKKGEAQRPNDPFYLTVVEGAGFPVLVRVG